MRAVLQAAERAKGPEWRAGHGACRSRSRSTANVRARRRCPPPARPLHPRRPRADGHARRLRHRQLRRLHRARRRPGGEELHDARRPGRRRPHRHGRGARRGRRADARSSRPFTDHHALQCGYCTPGMLMSATRLLAQNPHPSEDEVRKALQGNICRCTGYVNIVEAVVAAGRGREVSDSTASTTTSHREGRRSGEGLRRPSACRARRTSGSSRARASSSTTSAATEWATSISSARRTRTRRSSRSTSRRRLRWRGCTGRSPATRWRSRPTPSSRCRSRRATRSSDYALAVGKARFQGEPVAAVCAATPRARPRRGRAGRGRVRAPRRPRRRPGGTEGRGRPARRSGHERRLVGRLRLGRRGRRARRGRPRREDQEAALPPLLVHAARVLRRTRRVRAGHGAVDAPLQPPDARRGRDLDGARAAHRHRQAALRHP